MHQLRRAESEHGPSGLLLKSSSERAVATGLWPVSLTRLNLRRRRRPVRPWHLHVLFRNGVFNSATTRL
jgi:hypothetical protein